MSGLLRVVEGSTTADRHMLVRIDKMYPRIDNTFRLRVT